MMSKLKSRSVILKRIKKKSYQKLYLEKNATAPGKEKLRAAFSRAS